MINMLDDTYFGMNGFAEGGKPVRLTSTNPIVQTQELNLGIPVVGGTNDDHCAKLTALNHQVIVNTYST